MLISGKPRKQRQFRYNAPMHVRQKFAHAHVPKDVREKLGIKKKSIEIRRGDTAKVVRGANKGKSGKVANVDIKRNFVFIEGISRKVAKGKEILVPIRPSNVYITNVDLTDKYRRVKLTGKA
ncbi:MAG: 50S ribosomal protein L24 [Candidatus Micrarchaeaceae archaeon]